MSPSDVFVDSPLKEVDEAAEGVKPDAVKTEIVASAPTSLDQPVVVEDSAVESPKKEIKDEVKDELKTDALEGEKTREEGVVSKSVDETEERP